MKLCSCGSGQPRRVLRDGAGIFCTYVCDRCELERRALFDPFIFRNDTNYAATGEEQDIP